MMKKLISRILITLSITFGLCQLAGAEVTDSTEFLNTTINGEPQRTAKQKDLEALYPYAAASYFSYRFKVPSTKTNGEKELIEARLNKMGYRNATPVDVPTEWIINGTFEVKAGADRIYDFANSGLKARVFINDRSEQTKVIIAFTGTEFDSATSILNALQTQMGVGYGYMAQYLMLPYLGEVQPLQVPMLRKALEITLDIQKKYGKAKIELTGSSLGGAIAQFVAHYTELNAVVFNSLALNPAIKSQMALDLPNMKADADLITHAYVEGELLNGGYTSSFIQGTIPYLLGSIEVQSQVIPVSDTMAAKIDGYTPVTTPWHRHRADNLMLIIEDQLKLNFPQVTR